MDNKTELNRQTMFALLSAAVAGIVSIVLIAFFIDMLHWLFVPSVMIMVFISAYFAFGRRLKGRGELENKRIILTAFEVGTLTHFYTFALYLPLYFFFSHPEPMSADVIGRYIFGIFFGGGVSLCMFVWIAVPMYIGVGYIQKNFEKDLYFDDESFNDSLIDDDFILSEHKSAPKVELD